METPFFFENGATKLFGVTHTPDGTAENKGYILIHAFGEEKLWSHRVFVNFAREAAARGFPVLRFDLAGHGDSEGDSENCTVASYLTDIESARRTFRTIFPDTASVGLLGLRFGATLAFLSAGRSDNLDDLILWEPILNGARYMQELLRVNLGTQLAVYGKVTEDREVLVEKMRQGTSTNVDGYLISIEFFDDCSNIDFTNSDLKSTNVSSLVVQIAPNIKQKDRQEFIDLANRLPNGSFLKTEEPPFWREIKLFGSQARNLVGETLDWLEKLNGR